MSRFRDKARALASIGRARVSHEHRDVIERALVEAFNAGIAESAQAADDFLNGGKSSGAGNYARGLKLPVPK